jgi:hypothetical protein
MGVVDFVKAADNIGNFLYMIGLKFVILFDNLGNFLLFFQKFCLNKVIGLRFQISLKYFSIDFILCKFFGSCNNKIIAFLGLFVFFFIEFANKNIVLAF